MHATVCSSTSIYWKDLELAAEPTVQPKKPFRSSVGWGAQKGHPGGQSSNTSEHFSTNDPKSRQGNKAARGCVPAFISVVQSQSCCPQEGLCSLRGCHLGNDWVHQTHNKGRERTDSDSCKKLPHVCCVRWPHWSYFSHAFLHKHGPYPNAFNSSLQKPTAALS